MVMETCYPERLVPFLSEVSTKSTWVIDSNVRSDGGSNIRRKLWNREEVQFEGDAAARSVIAMGDKGIRDHDSGLMDMGLDSLGVVEVSRSLQLYFRSGSFIRSSIQQTINKKHIRVHLRLGVTGGGVNGEVGNPGNSNTASEAIVGREWSFLGMMCQFLVGCLDLAASDN